MWMQLPLQVKQVQERHYEGSSSYIEKSYPLNLGGKNPNIIFADSDLDDAIETTLEVKFYQPR